jgi:uncharacterized protein
VTKVDLPKCRLTTWAEVGRWADVLASQIVGAGPLPQTIVGLTRGGWVPARLLADRLGVHRLVALRAQHWGVTATKSGRAELTEELSGPVARERVLIVDDITDTGESLDLARAHVAERRPASLATATLLHITHSKFLPDFYAEEIPRKAWVWVVFPWNYWEDLNSLAQRATVSGAGPEGARRVLARECGLKVPLADVTRALGLASAR